MAFPACCGKKRFSRNVFCERLVIELYDQAAGIVITRIIRFFDVIAPWPADVGCQAGGNAYCPQ